MVNSSSSNISNISPEVIRVFNIPWEKPEKDPVKEKEKPSSEKNK